MLAALNRADEIGGEVRDFLQERVAADPRYVAMRKRIATWLGRAYESRAEQDNAAREQQMRVAAAAATTPATKPVARGFGDASVKAQVFGRKSCPWSGRAITLLERNKVDYDFVDLDEPEHEGKLAPLTAETHQHTVPFVYLRGHFVGGFNALSEIERLGQLEVALMTPEERAQAAPDQQHVVIAPRPNTDEVAPVDQDPSGPD